MQNLLRQNERLYTACGIQLFSVFSLFIMILHNSFRKGSHICNLADRIRVKTVRIFLFRQKMMLLYTTTAGHCHVVLYKCSHQ
jgi:hypothetical protein